MVPSETWTPLVEEAWQSGARSDEKPTDGFRYTYLEYADWVSWAPTALASANGMSDAAEMFAKAVARGFNCAGFTSDLAWLPSDLLMSADHRLTLPLLTGTDVVAIAHELCGDEPSTSLSDEQAAMLTPRLLRLGYRPYQSANTYLEKLRELLQQVERLDAVAAGPISRSVREEPTLARLHGMGEAVAWGLNVDRDLQAFRQGMIAWADVDRGLLLSGSPGCGKTLFARALATTCQVPLITGSYGEWHGTGNAHQGDLLKAMRLTFANARKAAPSILFIDEVDSFPNRGTITHQYADWEIQVVNNLLSEIDGVGGRDGVILLAACNHPDKLDPALIRSGRLDRHIRINLPDRADLSRILREHLGAELPDEDLSAAALMAAGSTGADCERFVRGARRRARGADRPLQVTDLVSEIGGTDRRADWELKLAAIHEAGHAVACSELHPGGLVTVTLRSDDNQGGGVLLVPFSGYVTAPDIHRQMVMMLAGRAAEEAILGRPSSGAGGGADSDLANATRLATGAATSLGLDAEFGMVWSGVPEHATLPRMLREAPALAGRVRAVVDAAYADALALIRRRVCTVNALAVTLLEKRALDGLEVASIVAEHPGEVA